MERGLEVAADSLDPDKIQSLVFSKYELDYLRVIAGQGAFVATGFKASRAVLENNGLLAIRDSAFRNSRVARSQKPEKVRPLSFDGQRSGSGRGRLHHHAGRL